MTERKPAGMSWESWIERQIREAQERGEFEGLPGAGKPIPGLDRPHDELWWLKQLLQRENLSVTPETLTLRKELEDVRERIAKQGSEGAVRRIVAAINRRLAEANAKAVSGPASTLVPLDPDRVVAAWRARRRPLGDAK